MAEAHRRMEAGSHVGKIVLTTGAAFASLDQDQGHSLVQL